MRGRFACALGVVIGLAACGEDPGVYLTIKGTGITSVAVYIGDDTCTDSSGAPCPIAPMGGFDRIHPSEPGGTWFRDSDRPFVAGASGGTARVRIQPSGKPDKVQVIVLGLDGDGTPIAAKVVRDLDVPANNATSVSMTLDPASPFDGNPHPTGTFYERWGDPSAVSDCVFVQQWDNGQPMDTFIVPEEDGDCDGIPTLDMSGHKNPLECDPYWFKFADRIGAADCAENRDMVSNLPACLLGGQACTDGIGLTAGSCTRADPTTCVSGTICDSVCMTPGDTTPLSTCAGTTGGTLTGTGIHCTVYMESASGASCTALGSAGFDGAMDLAPLFPNAAHQISAIAFAPLDQLYGIESKLQKDQLITMANDLEIDIISKKAGTQYGYDLRWKHGSASLVTGPHYSVADITIDQGSNEPTHMRMPVRIDLGDCTNATVGVSCYSLVQQMDAITSCGM